MYVLDHSIFLSFIRYCSTTCIFITVYFCNGNIFKFNILYLTSRNRSEQSCCQTFDLISISVKRTAKCRNKVIISLNHTCVYIMLQSISSAWICLHLIDQRLHRNIFCRYFIVRLRTKLYNRAFDRLSCLRSSIIFSVKFEAYFSCFCLRCDHFRNSRKYLRLIFHLNFHKIIFFFKFCKIKL